MGEGSLWRIIERVAGGQGAPTPGRQLQCSAILDLQLPQFNVRLLDVDVRLAHRRQLVR